MDHKYCRCMASAMGGAVAKWLVSWTPERAVRVPALAGAVRCVFGLDTLLS